MKFSRYLFFINISERTEDSDLSKILSKEQVVGTIPEWHRVNTFSPGMRHSPHYTFHSAFHQIAQLALWWKMEEVPPAVRKKTAQHLVALWKYAGSDSLAKGYLIFLPYAQNVMQRQAIFERIESLSMPLFETNRSDITVTVFYPDGIPLERCRGFFGVKGNFIRDGVSEMWHSDGRIKLYGHYKRGELDDRRFQWEKDGKLSCIEVFRSGDLIKYESKDLDQHTDCKIAQQISTTNWVCPNYSATNQASALRMMKYSTKKYAFARFVYGFLSILFGAAGNWKYNCSVIGKAPRRQLFNWLPFCLSVLGGLPLHGIGTGTERQKKIFRVQSAGLKTPHHQGLSLSAAPVWLF